MTKSKLIKEVQQGFKASRSLVQPLIERRNRNLDLYTGFSATTRVENADGIREHVPYTKTLLDNTLPLLTAKLPQAKAAPRNTAKHFAQAKFMNELINLTYDVNDYQEKFPMNVKEAMLAGDHMTKVIWNPNPEKNYPLITSIDINNVSTHPSKLDLEDEYPIYLRREMTKKQMKDETGWDKDAIDSLPPSKLNTESYRMQQMKKLGLPPDKNKETGEPEWNLYEVVERWGMMDFKGNERKMGCVVLCNETTILNPEPYFDGMEAYESPFANNVMPFSQLSWDRLPNVFWSMSFIDPIVTQQIELNDLESMKKSNYIRRNNPPIIVDKNAGVDLKSLKMLAGLPWEVDGVTNIVPFILPDLAPSIQNQQMMVRQTMQNVTGSTDALMSNPDQMGSDGGRGHKISSASHAQMVQESIRTRFMVQAQNIDRYVERVGKLIINLWQDKRYWVGMKAGKIAVSIADDEGNNSEVMISHDKVQGDIDYIVTSASSIAKSDMANATQAANLLQLFSQDPTLDLTPLKRDIFQSSGYDFNSIQKPKASFLPQLQQQLEQLVTVMKQPNFQQLPQVEQQKVVQQAQDIEQKIQQLEQQSRGGSEENQGAQLQPEAVQ